MEICSRLTREMVDKIVAEYPPQTPQEEAEMCRKYADNPDRLHELLVYHNLAFMMGRVKNYHMRTEDGDDFFMFGVKGLVEAAEKFDPSLGKRFTTLAEYYIMRAARNVFTPSLKDVQTNTRTSAIFDAPTSLEDEDAATIGDWLATHSSPANWAPPDPADSLKAVMKQKENKELIDWLCNYILPDTIPNNCYKACKLYMAGHSIRQIQEKLKIRRAVVINAVNNYLPKIAKAIARAKPGSELHNLLKRHKAAPKERLRAEFVYEFLNQHQITIDRHSETDAERVERLMGDFDTAVALKTAAMGRYGIGADFTAMRLVYERHVKWESINSISEHLGIPLSYAQFLRERSVNLVKEYIAGKLDLALEGQESKPIHVVNDYDENGQPVYLTEDDIELPEKTDSDRRKEFIARVTTKYERMQQQAKKFGRKRGLVTTYARFRGGFYTMQHYLWVSGNYRNKMSPRQVEMMARLNSD